MFFTGGNPAGLSSSPPAPFSSEFSGSYLWLSTLEEVARENHKHISGYHAQPLPTRRAQPSRQRTRKKAQEGEGNSSRPWPASRPALQRRFLAPAQPGGFQDGRPSNGDVRGEIQAAGEVIIQQQLTKIHNNVKGLQRQLKDVRPTPEFVDRLKEIMEDIENSINNFKEEQRQTYEELLRQEKTSTNELNALERKIEMWTLGTSATENKFRQGKVPVNKENQKNLPNEVLELEKFLQQTGGRFGGWDEYDHQIFLKLWTKHKGKPSYMEEAHDYFCERKKEDIQQHEKWYQEFLILEARKKEAIKKWKMKKQQEREKILAPKESPEKVSSPNLHREKAQKQKAEEERKARLEDLEKWRRQKAIEHAMKQVARLKEEEEKEKKMQRERERQFQMKLLLEEYGRQKKEQEYLVRLENEKKEEVEREERKRTAAEEILKFQERDLHKLELKILEKQMKEGEKMEKEKRLSKLREKVEINVSRDPCRLYKPTKVWEERTKEIGPVGTEPLMHIPHRAVPTWRQGL